MGGSWGGQNGVDNDIFPREMEVDYVRVYEFSNVKTLLSVPSQHHTLPAIIWKNHTITVNSTLLPAAALQFFSMNGTLVADYTDLFNTSNNKRYRLSLPTGMYIVLLESGLVRQSLPITVFR